MIVVESIWFFTIISFQFSLSDPSVASAAVNEEAAGDAGKAWPIDFTRLFQGKCFDWLSTDLSCWPNSNWDETAPINFIEKKLGRWNHIRQLRAGSLLWTNGFFYLLDPPCHSKTVQLQDPWPCWLVRHNPETRGHYSTRRTSFFLFSAKIWFSSSNLWRQEIFFLKLRPSVKGRKICLKVNDRNGSRGS